MLLLTLACTAPDDGPIPGDSEAAVDSPGPVDSDSGTENPLTTGDPISTVRTYEDGFQEWMDAEILPDGRAILAGVTGYAVYDTISGEALRWPEGHGDGRAYRVTVDGDFAWLGSRADRLRKIDLSVDPPDWAPIATDRPFDGYHEDLSADDGRLMIAGLDAGLSILDADGYELSRIAGDNVIGCALQGDRGVYSDGKELILLDMTDASAPVELDRVEMRGIGRDIDFEGDHVAVAMGGSGVDTFDVIDDDLVLTGELDLPGSSFGIDIDGEWAWIATWEVIGLAWLGEGGPVVVGHQDPGQSAMGLGARDDIAIIADWMKITMVKRNGDVMGPEVHPPDTLRYQEGNTTPLPMVWTNWGAETLELELSGTNVDLSDTTLSLAPGEGKLVTVTPNNGDGRVFFTSNDPDESSGDVLVAPSDVGIGSQHPDMEVQGFLPPDGAVETYTLSDYLGKPVVLAYWTTW